MLDLPLNNFAWGDIECVENIEFFFKTRNEAFEGGGVMMSWNEFFGESNKSISSSVIYHIVTRQN